MPDIDFSKIELYNSESEHSIDRIEFSLAEFVKMPVKDVLLGIEFYDGEAAITLRSVLLQNGKELKVGANVMVDAPVIDFSSLKNSKLKTINEFQEKASLALTERQNAFYNALYKKENGE